MWKPLGVQVELYNTETKVHYDEMQRGQVEIGRAGWIADYNDPDNFLGLLVSDVSMNYGRWSNADYDKLVKEANAQTDLKKRAEIFKQAEQLALDDSAAIPLRRQYSGHPSHALAVCQRIGISALPHPGKGRSTIMIKYALRRLLSTIPVLWIAVTLSFFVLRLAPGGPFDGERPLPPVILKNLAAHYNLDKPLIEQYLIYMFDVLKGDLGPSFANQDFSVTQQLMLGLPYTFTIGGSAFVLAIVIGVTVGCLGALYQNKAPDYLLGLLILIGLVLPNFLIAPILQLVFGIRLGWLPVGGWGNGSIRYLILPVLVLALPHAGRISRMTRGSMIEVMNQNYIRTAKAKGIGPRLTVMRHALKPAMMPVVSYLGPAASYLLTGSLVVESIFGLPGIGRYFINAALNRDYGMVLGTVIFYMVLIVVLNLIVDIAYAWLDPKVRSR
jgi:oligopeptide transport system permease protein